MFAKGAGYQVVLFEAKGYTFNGTMSEIKPDQAKLKVLVNISVRETPVELAFDQVAKVKCLTAPRVG